MPRGVFKGHLDFKRYASNLSELTANLTARKIIGVDVNLLERAFHDVQRLRYELGLLNKEKNILAKNAKQGPVDKEAGRRAREEADRKAAELSAAEETLSDVTLRCPNWTDPRPREDPRPSRSGPLMRSPRTPSPRCPMTNSWRSLVSLTSNRAERQRELGVTSSKAPRWPFIMP